MLPELKVLEALPTVKTSSFHGVERSEVGLKYLPQPDYLDFSLPVTHVTLITNEGSDLTTKVFSQLEANGHKVVVLNLPNIANPVKVNSINLASHSDEAIKEAIEAVRKQFGVVGSFIHLHPHFEFQNGNFVQHFPKDKEVVKTLFFLAKHLQQPLNALGKKHNQAKATTIPLTIKEKLDAFYKDSISDLEVQYGIKFNTI